jgi:DNA polymerase/3'-5' exonuclease PolX
VGGPSQRFSQLAELQALDLPPTNAEIAELLSREASEASYVLQRAYRRAARSAFLWEVEARDLVAQKRPTELPHIGPFLARTPSGIAIHSSLQRIAFLNRAMPQHESAPFLRIFSG